MAHTYGGIGLCRSLSLQPFSRSLSLHLSGDPSPSHISGAPSGSHLSRASSPSHSSADSSLFQPSGLFDDIYIFCSRSICTNCTILGEGHWPSRAD
ncbi:hypothetical protein Taro_053870 [Colocasia esculenta]|uniref:Uncharacterized protein n=1 Tax=Colocasia esculenta TaxID=4460 RepID=A0A843XNU7_COLES|nr:hypothetical protein [Colocasia esculenta]